MRGGALRHLVQLQRRATTQESTYGSQDTTWTTYATVYAAIEPLNGRELLAAEAVQSEVTHQITIRWNRGFTVKAADRVAFGARMFDVQDVINLNERNYEVDITAIEGVTQG